MASAMPRAQDFKSKREVRLRNESRKFGGLELETEGVCVEPSSDLFNSPWTVYIQGPLSTIWESGVFKAEITFPEKYPMLPFTLKFAEGIFHPNIGEDGTVCSRMVGDQWSPIFNVLSVLTYTRALLASPNFSAEDQGEMQTAEDEARALAEEEVARKHGGQGGPQKLYHYTDPAAIEKIRASRMLKESASGAGGAGVYATSLHPTNRTKAQILGSNYGGGAAAPPTNPTGKGARHHGPSRADFVIELDVNILAQEGHTIGKLELGKSRDVWLITRAQRPHDIRLSDVNSSISSFESFGSCTLNKLAERWFKTKQEMYEIRVRETIEKFGQQLLKVRRQCHEPLQVNQTDKSNIPCTQPAEEAASHHLTAEASETRLEEPAALQSCTRAPCKRKTEHAVIRQQRPAGHPELNGPAKSEVSWTDTGKRAPTADTTPVAAGEWASAAAVAPARAEPQTGADASMPASDEDEDLRLALELSRQDADRSSQIRAQVASLEEVCILSDSDD